MTAALAVPQTRALALAQGGQEAERRARELVAKRRSSNTQRAYAGAWERFEEWAVEQDANALPAAPELVAAYLGHLDLERLSPSTVDVALAAIAMRHRDAGISPPTESAEVRAVRSGLRRERGTAPAAQKAPMGPAELRAVVAVLNLAEPLDARDAALLLLAFWTALRRSELVGLDIDDVVERQEGLEVSLGASKTDQEGLGVVLPAPRAVETALCPVAALETWLKHRGRGPGALFLSGRGKRLAAADFARRLKLHAARAGLDPALFGGHSPRAGFVTTALEQEAPPTDIMRITRHTTVAMLSRYDRRRVFAVKPVAL